MDRVKTPRHHWQTTNKEAVKKFIREVLGEEAAEEYKAWDCTICGLKKICDPAINPLMLKDDVRIPESADKIYDQLKASAFGVVPDVVRRYFVVRDKPFGDLPCETFIACLVHGKEWQLFGTDMTYSESEFEENFDIMREIVL
jgi:hypothetical protein